MQDSRDLASAREGLDRPVAAGKPARLFSSVWVWPLVYAALFLAFFALRGPRGTANPESPDRFYLLTGDEPHYLLLSHSVAFDGDVDLANNRAAKDYEAYYDRTVSGYVKTRDYWLKYVKGRLKTAPPEYWSGRCLSMCPVGMPILVAPVYRLVFLLGKRIRFSVVIFMHMLAAGIGVLMMLVTWRITGHRWVAVGMSIVFALSAPLLYYTVPIFPDLPGAFAMLLGVWLMLVIEDGRRWPATPCLGCVAGFLPWLHARFWPAAGLLMLGAACILWLQRQTRWRMLIVLAAAFTICAAPLLVYYYRLYGIPFPVSTHPPMSPGIGMRSGWPGLWLDRNNGLLWYAPVAVYSFAGAWCAWRSKRVACRIVVLLIAGNWLLVGSFSDWHGGLCPPLRYWVSVMPFVAVLSGVAIAAVGALWSRVLAVAGAMGGVVIGVASMLEPGRQYKYAHPVLPYWPRSCTRGRRMCATWC
jgi:hypothetical protein